MGEEHLSAPAFALRKVSELSSIVNGNSLEYLCKAVAIPSPFSQTKSAFTLYDERHEGIYAYYSELFSEYNTKLVL